MPSPIREETILGDCRLLWGDALGILPTLEAASVQLILTDPPYHRVKAEAWDRQWLTREAYLSWLRQLAKEWQRVLTPNGSLYCFASPQMAAWVEVTLSETFNVLNHIVWRKHDGSGAGTGGHSKVCKEDLMSYFPQTERLLFAEQYGSEYEDNAQALHMHVFAPLGRYIATERIRSGATRDEVDVALGYVRTKNPARGTELCRRWEEGSSLPTRETYERLRAYLNSRANTCDYLRREYEDLRREYEDLRREYEDLRREYEDLRRPFTVSAKVNFTDVWEYKTVQAAPGKHPAEKPLAMLRHIIQASSRPGDTVLDSCAGSFSTLEAARDCGRKGIGIEQEHQWYAMGKSRLAQQALFTVEEG